MTASITADPEKLYQYVYTLQGIRNPITNQSGLDCAADMLADWMDTIGLSVREQVFYLHGWEKPFRNIEGSLGSVDGQPAAVLMAHYDTVEISPGANDNAAGCAVLLEVSRILGQMDDPVPVYFVAATLEESKSNPLIYGRERQSAIARGVMTLQGYYTSWEHARWKTIVDERAIEIYESGESQGKGYQTALEEYGSQLTPAMRQHIEDIIPLYENISVQTSIGLRSRIGSHCWVREALRTNKKIAYNITVDEPGIYSDEPFSQGRLGKYGFEIFTHRFGLDECNRVGNFIFMATNYNSHRIGEVFSEYCQRSEVHLPYGWVDVPFTFNQIAKKLPQGLGSDHAAFWQANIPAMFLFDSSTARDPWVHTQADTIDHIDFDRLAQFTQALAATVADIRLLGGEIDERKDRHEI